MTCNLLVLLRKEYLNQDRDKINKTLNKALVSKE